MKKYLIVILCLILFKGLQAQRSSDKLTPPLNKKYLEHLIKIKIDSVREKHKLKSLVNDSILYVASQWHANYLNKNRKLSHYERDIPNKETPQLRAEFYGAKNYSVGENVLKTKYNVDIKNKKNKILPTYTYDQLAYSIVDGWVNSPGHFKNIITEDYEITGLAITIDEKKKMVYAVQKFAKVLYKFNFKESKEMFPYSDYKMPKVTNSFENIPNTLIKNHAHDWKIKHGTEKKCQDCISLLNDKPFISVEYRKNAFYLIVQNSEYVQKLIRDKKDGFAIEIVEFEDYACGNPNYYEKPSRRNGQCHLNGRVLKPVYRNELLKGFKKRKLKDTISFVSYLFKRRPGSPFFKRFSTYKMDKYTSEYFEIRLGKLPKDINGLWAHNLVYIQNNEVCNIDYFTSYCGDVFEDYQDVSLLQPPVVKEYAFKDKKGKYTFEFPFEKNKAIIRQEDISPFLEKFTATHYQIDSIYIKAYSSIEGNPDANKILQQNRAQSIVNLLSKNSIDEIPSNIEVEGSWDSFYAKIKKEKKWKKLIEKEQNEILEYVNKNVNEFEDILSEDRKAEVEILVTVPYQVENLAYFIESERDKLLSELEEDENKPNAINQLNKLYAYAQYQYNNGNIKLKHLLELFKDYPLVSPKIGERYVDNYFQLGNVQEAENLSKTQDELSKQLSNLSKWYIYNLVVRQSEILQEKVKQKDIQNLFSALEYLKVYYIYDPERKEEIEKIGLNLNLLLLNKVFIKQAEEKSKEARQAIEYIYKYYQERDLLSESILISISKVAVKYSQIDFAIEVLYPNVFKSPIVFDQFIQLSFAHISIPQTEEYYKLLISAFENNFSDDWCNLFFEKCKIPFQAFDYEPLRNLFCQECLQRSTFYNKLQKGE